MANANAAAGNSQFVGNESKYMIIADCGVDVL